MHRKLLIFLIALLAIMAITTGAGWFLLHDEAFLKSRLSALALKHTGRQLTLNGPLTLDPGRITTLEANGILFANAAWAEQPDMVSIGQLKISVDIFSLFSERPVVPFLGLKDCEFSLLKNDAGSANWDVLQSSESAAEEPAGEQPGETLPARLDDLQIDSCKLLLTSPHLAQPLDIKVSSLSMQQHDGNRWEGRASGSINDKPLSFDGWLAPFRSLITGGPLTHELSASLGEVTLHSSGSVQDAATWSGADVTAEFKGPEIADFLTEFELPRFSEGEFDFKLALNTQGDMTLVDLDGDLGSLEMSAKGELDRLLKPSDGNIQFRVDGPNLGALAKIFGVDGLVEEAFHHQSQFNFGQEGVQVSQASLKTDRDQLEVGGHFRMAPGFAGTNLDVHFRSDEAGRWTTVFGQPQQALGPLDLEARLSSDADGLIEIKANATQAATTLAAEGSLGHLPDGFKPDLDIAFASPDPSHLAAVAGLKRVPAAPLAIKGRMALDGEKLSLDNVNINLAGDQANIEGRVNLHDRFAGSDFSLHLDVRNAGALGRLFGEDGIPDEPFNLAIEVKPDGNGLAFQVRDGDMGEVQLEISGRIPDLQHPLKMDGTFDINLPRLSYVAFLVPGTRLPDVPFTAGGSLTSLENSIKLNNIAINLAGDLATVNGVLNLGNRYAGSDLHAQVEIKNAGALGRMFGQEGIPDQPVKLEAEVKPQGKGLAFALSDGNLGDLQLEMQGQIADLDHLLGLDAEFDIGLPRLSDISFLFKERDLPDVPFSASGRLHNEQARTHLEQVQVTVGKIQARIDGDLFPGERFDLTIQAAGPDVSGLAMVLLGQPLLPDPFTLAARLTGTREAFELADLQASLGDSKADGQLNFALGDVTHIKGKIDASYLDISQWIDEEEAEKAGQAKPTRRWVFDDRPVRNVTDLSYVLDLDIRADRLKLNNSLLQDLELGLLLTHNQLEMNPFTLKDELGSVFSGEFRLDDRGAIPQLHINLHGDDVRIGLVSVEGQDPSTYPPMQLDLLFDASGKSRREMASSANGKLRAYFGSGDVASAGAKLLFTDFITELFSLLNPFSKTSKYTRLDCAVVAADAVAGMVEVSPIIYNTRELTIFSAGTIDLRSERVNLSFNTRSRRGLGLSASMLINPFIRVGGTLAAPAVELDPAGTVKSTGLAVATAGFSLLAKSMSDRFLSSNDPCGDARKEIEKRDSATR